MYFSGDGAVAIPLEDAMPDYKERAGGNAVSTCGMLVCGSMSRGGSKRYTGFAHQKGRCFGVNIADFESASSGKSPYYSTFGESTNCEPLHGGGYLSNAVYSFTHT